MATADPAFVPLDDACFDEAVEVLADAFRDYPVMRYVLKDAGEAYSAQLALLVRYFTEARIARGQPVLGVRRGGRLVAASNVNLPHPPPVPPSLHRSFARLAAEIGPSATRRLDAFAALGRPLVPEEPHVYLGMIGVRSDCQGQGHARRLLDAVHEISAAHSESRGVLLTTESPGNVALYEHFGYRVLGHGQLEELESWVMYRPESDA
jgi:ribosomal protein S18 acetylase RimI-like enzyme